MGGVAMFRKAAAAVVLALPLVSCSSGVRSNPTELQDTTGLTIPWQCNDKGCVTGPMAAFKTCEQKSGYTEVLGRLFGICASIVESTGGTTWQSADCRATACSSDADCPIFQNNDYVCEGGLCVNHDVPLVSDSEYLVEVCLSTTARPTDCTASQPEADALITVNCNPDGLTCTVPATCLQP
jgi:hypothetical protein